MNLKKRIAFISVSCLLATALAAASASAQSIVVPRVLQAVEGASNICFPFDLGDYSYNSQRYQQVYAASEFADAGGPIRITAIAFRPDTNMWASAFAGLLPGVQINLSTTSAGPGKLSPVFAENVGADDTIVFAGPLALSSKYTGPDNGPKEFDIRIELGSPFDFDPKAGNLLMDVRNFEGGTFLPFDAYWGPEDFTSCVYTYNVDGVRNPEGEFPATNRYGLVTQFIVGTRLREEPITVPVDIKPGGCPNPWNTKSDGVMPIAILGTAGFDVTTVDPATVRLAGVAPMRSALEDVATPFEPFTGKTEALACVSLGPDGFVDLSLKFDSREILAAIQESLGREVVDGTALIVPLTGNLTEAAGGREIRGEDVVVILKKGKK
jgi:hypothetical protein